MSTKNDFFYYHFKTYQFITEQTMYFGIHQMAPTINTCNFVGNAIQIFTRSPQSYNIKSNLKVESMKYIKSNIKKSNLKAFVHMGYLTNLCDCSDRAKDLLIADMKICSNYGLQGLVVHMGCKKKMSYVFALSKMIECINDIMNKTPKDSILILETSAGDGSKICNKIDEMEELYEKLEQKDRIKFCIDTCHVFSCGYDISTEIKCIKYLEEFNKKIGFNKLALFHLNDSKFEVGCKKDRHESIGKGFIYKNLNALNPIIKLCLKMNIPLVLETKDGVYSYEILIRQTLKVIKDSYEELKLKKLSIKDIVKFYIKNGVLSHSILSLF